MSTTAAMQEYPPGPGPDPDDNSLVHRVAGTDRLVIYHRPDGETSGAWLQMATEHCIGAVQQWA